MDYSDVIAKAWNRNILFSVMLELTYRCNLDCFYCYNDRRAQGQPMTMADYLRLLEELKAMGTMNLTFTGGEPLASPYFFKLGRAARAKGFVVRIKSNGHALDPNRALRLKREVDPFTVEVSLHGATAETHDRQTRVPGSFHRLMRNLQGMKEVGLRVQLNATLTSWNEGEMVQMHELAERLGMRLQMDARVTPRDDGDLTPLQIAPSRKAVERLMALKQLQVGAAPKQGKAVSVNYHCGAGVSSVTVDPWGRVYPCVQWRRPLGNLHQQSMQAIWECSPQLMEVRAINRQVKGMVDEQGMKKAAFCPGLAEQRTGSPLVFDGETLHRMDILRSIKKG